MKTGGAGGGRRGWMAGGGGGGALEGTRGPGGGGGQVDKLRSLLWVPFIFLGCLGCQPAVKQSMFYFMSVHSEVIFVVVVVVCFVLSFDGMSEALTSGYIPSVRLQGTKIHTQLFSPKGIQLLSSLIVATSTCLS